MQKQAYNLIAVVGATAGGKTSVATNLANILNGEIISADSRQVYRGMDIGTGKDLADYNISGTNIPYHLIDILDAGEKYNVYQYQKDFYKCFEDIQSRGKFPVVCGGTGLYLEAILKQYKLIKVPENSELRENLMKKSLEELSKILAQYKKLHNSSDTDTKERAIRGIEIEQYYENYPEKKLRYPEINPLIIGVKFDRLSRRKRITQRLHERLNEGMIEEVQQLMNNGVDKETLLYYGLEYKFITQYLTGEMEYENMIQKLEIAIHQFSKRQQTWYRKMERQGVKIHWLDGYMPIEEKINRIQSLFAQ